MPRLESLTDRKIERIELPAPSKRSEMRDPQTPGLFVKVTSTGVKTWMLDYAVLGKRSRKKIGDARVMSVDDAREKARDYLKVAEQSVDPLEAEKQRQLQEIRQKALSEANSFAAVRTEFLASYKGSRKKEIKKRTREEYRRYLEIEFNHWDGRPINSITSQDAKTALRKILDRGATTAVNRALASLKVMFGWAVEEEIIEHSPVAGIKKPGKEKDHHDALKSRFLTADELKAIWAACPPGNTYGDIIRMLILTGQRVGEVTKMRWQDIQKRAVPSLNGETAEVTVWRIPGGVDGYTKNQIAHDVYLPASALKIIDGCDILKGNDFVFHGRRHGKPFNGFSKAKTELDQACGISDWTVHDIRRTFVTMLNDDPLRIRSEVVEAIVNHVSGHKSGVAGIYNRATYNEERRQAMDAWGRYIEKIVSGHGSPNVVQMHG